LTELGTLGAAPAAIIIITVKATMKKQPHTDNQSPSGKFTQADPVDTHKEEEAKRRRPSKSQDNAPAQSQAEASLHLELEQTQLEHAFGQPDSEAIIGGPAGQGGSQPVRRVGGAIGKYISMFKHPPDGGGSAPPKTTKVSD